MVQAAKVLLAALGSYGDVNPFVGLGIALRSRGHDVTLLANDHFHSSAKQAGLDFASLGTAEEYDTMLDDPDLWHPRKGKRVLARQVTPRALSAHYRLIAELYNPGSTVLVASGLVFAARIAHETLGIPLATILLQPLLLRGAHEVPRAYIPLPDWIGPWGRRALYWLVDHEADRLLATPINVFRATLGRRPVHRLLQSWWLSPQRVIGLWPEWFATPRPDWPPNLSVTGFIPYSEPSARHVDLTPEHTPPIVFSPGSAMKHAHDFFAAAVEACERLKRPGWLITRYRDQLPRHLPDSVRHFAYLPFDVLLPTVAAIVHHGGLQTVAQALAAGIPQLIRPTSHDQFDNAYRVSRLGVGRTLRIRRFTAPHVVAALTELLGSPRVAERCRYYAALLHGTDAMEQTCRYIEALSGQDVPITA